MREGPRPLNKSDVKSDISFFLVLSLFYRGVLSVFHGINNLTPCRGPIDYSIENWSVWSICIFHGKLDRGVKLFIPWKTGKLKFSRAVADPEGIHGVSSATEIS